MYKKSCSDSVTLLQFFPTEAAGQSFGGKSFGSCISLSSGSKKVVNCINSHKCKKDYNTLQVIYCRGSLGPFTVENSGKQPG
jgi:hypothetical protein